MAKKALFSILLALGTIAMLTGGASESQAACSANQICNVGPGYYVACNGATTCTSTATYVDDRPRSNCDWMATTPTIAPTGGRIQPRRRESWSNTPSSSHLKISTDRGLTPYDEEGLLRCAEVVGARTVPTRVP